MNIFKIIYESVAQAGHALVSNRLRTVLSLLGISIGIFCIIGVFSAVDSLESNVRGSLQKLGNDVIYVKKWPWADVSNSWWDYVKRPQPDYAEYEVLKKKLRSAQLTSYHVVIGFKTLKYRNASVEQSVLIGVSPEFTRMFAVDFEKGRPFSNSEHFYGSNKIVLGHSVASSLFQAIDPIGKEVKMMGKKYEVIGVIEKAGQDLLNPLDFDDCIILSYNAARSIANLKSKQIFDVSITAKAAQNVSMSELKDEVTGILRAHRRIKPKQDETFSINELTMLSSLFDGFFSILNIIGLFIGGFSILVGGFSVANIMFVSVKERTNIIGVKKALGAKKHVILTEFLIESIILCLIGGLIGLIIVFGIVEILSKAIDFELFLSMNNVLLGLGISMAIGVISGFIPALQAANMDPVEAMRQ